MDAQFIVSSYSFKPCIFQENAHHAMINQFACILEKDIHENSDQYPDMPTNWRLMVKDGCCIVDPIQGVPYYPYGCCVLSKDLMMKNALSIDVLKPLLSSIEPGAFVEFAGLSAHMRMELYQHSSIKIEDIFSLDYADDFKLFAYDDMMILSRLGFPVAGLPRL